MEEEFSPLELKAWGDFLWAYSRLMVAVEDDLASKFHLTHPEYEVLLRLSWEKGKRMRIQDLAGRSILTRSGISRVVDRLAKAGLVTKETAPEDRRGAYAVMTPRGEELFKSARASHVAVVRQVFLSRFSTAEQKLLGEFWDRITRNEGLNP